jgi:hypothetical protein
MSTTPQQAQQEFMADLRRSGEVWPVQAAPDPDEPSTCVTSVALVAVALSIVVPCLVIVFTNARKPCIPTYTGKRAPPHPSTSGRPWLQKFNKRFTKSGVLAAAASRIVGAAGHTVPAQQAAQLGRETGSPV